MLKIFCVIINLFSMGNDCQKMDVVDSQLFESFRMCEQQEFGATYSGDDSNDIESEDFVDYINI